MHTFEQSFVRQFRDVASDSHRGYAKLLTQRRYTNGTTGT